VRITDFGRDVLAGRADAAARRGVDRWFGGTHLSGSSPQWRWDETMRRVVETT
jgi:hypothetical protein